SRRLSEVKGLFRPSYLAIFFIIAGPWFAIEAYINGWDFFDSFVIRHHIQRYSAVISGHSGPPYFYIAVLILGFFPWAALLPGALYRGFVEVREKFLSLPLLASVWFAFVFIFFSISKTKLPNYIFPLFPASAILAGLAFTDIIEKRPGAGRRWLYALSVLSAAMAAFMFILPSMDVKMPFAFPPVLYYGLGATSALIAALGLTAQRHALPSFLGISFLSAAFIIMMRLWALPSANIALQGTLYDYSLYSRGIGPGAVLATYELNKPSIPFYAGRKVEAIEKANACNIKEHAKRSDLLVITSPSFYNEAEELKPLAVIDQSGDYILLGTEGMPPFK
ncbi:MAG: hypothetical protein Q8P48_00115, partial [Deltaproteobacteria bacterium]|nr:hypothetical protein [Deltaproteobacteria bacterium]